MSKINLLPWRNEIKKIENRKFVAMFISTILCSVFVLCFIHMIINHKISTEHKNILYIESELEKLSGKVEQLLKLQETKKMLLNQIEILQILQADRISMAKLLDILVRYVPDGIYFKDLTRKEIIVPNTNQALNNPDQVVDQKTRQILDKQYQVEISGVAQSNAAITELLKNLEHEKWFREVQLIEVSRDKNGRDLNFKMNLLHTVTEV